jgi:hypothetical protein
LGRQRKSRDQSHNCEVSVLLAERFAKYDQDKEDDYRHWMLVNSLAFGLLIALIAVGVWLMVNIKGEVRSGSRSQDHFLTMATQVLTEISVSTRRLCA